MLTELMYSAPARYQCLRQWLPYAPQFACAMLNDRHQLALVVNEIVVSKPCRVKSGQVALLLESCQDDKELERLDPSIVDDLVAGTVEFGSDVVPCGQLIDAACGYECAVIQRGCASAQ